MVGKLIAIEGIDGSGKQTQTKLLCDYLETNGIAYRKISFPCYSSESSALVKMYLQGKFGENPADVSAYAASVFYAVDRYASYITDWGEFYRNGGIIVADRYVQSNGIHQGSKVQREYLGNFFSWLYDFEYNKMGIPKPDCVVFLKLSVDMSASLRAARELKNGTVTDIHESNKLYLEGCAEMANWLAKVHGWCTVDCAREDGQILKSETAIHEEILDRLQPLLHN